MSLSRGGPNAETRKQEAKIARRPMLIWGAVIAAVTILATVYICDLRELFGAGGAEACKSAPEVVKIVPPDP